MFEVAKNQVENILGLYADSFVTMPAAGLYQPEMLKHYEHILERCHIYIVGYTPILDVKSFDAEGKHTKIGCSIGGKVADFVFATPEGFERIIDDGELYFANAEGERLIPDPVLFAIASGGLPFEVRYVGQSFGKEGERSAVTRLLKHEKLQKIAILGAPKNYELTVLVLEVATPQLMTWFNPFAQDMNNQNADTRLDMGISKLNGTTHIERINLFEASLIRYFQPHYNKVFKDSFPSSDHKILRDCYDKDFLALTTEICFDHFPWHLFSDKVEASPEHIASFDLAEDEDRKAFFFDRTVPA